MQFAQTIQQKFRRYYRQGEHHVRVWVETYLTNGPVGTLLNSRPIVYYLTIVTSVSLLASLLAYLYQVLALVLNLTYHVLTWVLQLASVLLYYTAMAVSFLLSWAVFSVEVASRYTFVLAFPALFLTILFALVFGKRGRIHRLDEYQQVALETLVAVGLGQVMLVVLPPSLRVLLPTNPLVALLLIALVMVLVGMATYGVLVVSKRQEPPAAGRVRDEPNDKCVVCLVNEKSVVLRPCKHLALCTHCVRQLDKCPLCRNDIVNHERVYTT